MKEIDNLKNDTALYSIVIIQNGKTIHRQFYNSKTEDDLFNIQSITKSIMALLIGIAIDKGYVKSVNQTISNFFPEILNDKDTLKNQITIRHLLTQTSGLKDFEYPQLDKWVNDFNPTNLILSQPLITKPGIVYQYNTAATHLLSAIIHKVSNVQTAKFAEDNLFNLLGVTTYKWGKLKDGYNDGGGLSLWMKTDDLAKIGELLLNYGKYNNQQVISEQWVNELFSKENKLKALCGLKDSLHGYCWYEADYKNQIINYAAGYGGQFIFIFPSLQTVTAVNHNHATAEGIKQLIDFIKNYLSLIFDAITIQIIKSKGKM